ncbi:apoptosis facilitator Bcl-2-like protein 14 [Megalops cyprinoides]|uniref:apoptosis facilitator Bcl-2-like protein 14 n=1 Tax=Megalops cyprinoides TaxID=118141 RepID=UPI001864AFCC|nr:apoptosis facilitator Bcl-2-like protein 14 [Megalops cyprinoides]
MENGDGGDGVLGAAEKSVELELLQAYVQKRRPSTRRLQSATALSFRSQGMKEKKKKKKAGAGDELDKVADKLTNIVDSVHLAPADIDHDGPEDVVQTIVELLRESGDKLDEEIRQNKSLADLFSGFNYGLFEKVTTMFLKGVELEVVSSTKSSEQAKIALTFEVTSKLTAVDNHPMNRVMGFGAKYLQQNFSTWVQQQGGWAKAFDSEDIE